MKTLVLCICLLLISTNSFAQDSDEIITKPIYQLFDGFKANDSAKVAYAFYSRNPYLGTSFIRQGKSMFSDKANLNQILKAVAQPKPDSVQWDERIYNLEVMQDDGLAMVYCPYSFYVGDTFSHCGVNFFTLAKKDNEWKILSITDTRRKNACLD